MLASGQSQHHMLVSDKILFTDTWIDGIKIGPILHQSHDRLLFDGTGLWVPSSSDDKSYFTAAVLKNWESRAGLRIRVFSRVRCGPGFLKVRVRVNSIRFRNHGLLYLLLFNLKVEIWQRIFIRRNYALQLFVLYSKKTIPAWVSLTLHKFSLRMPLWTFFSLSKI